MGNRLFPVREWILAVVLIVILSLGFYFVLGVGAKTSVVNQLFSTQQVIARSEASNIDSFFQLFGKSVSVLSQSTGLQTRNKTTITTMDAFVDQWSNTGFTKDAILTDKSGIVEFNSNSVGPSDVGVNVSDRDYFVWGQKQTQDNQFYIGKPVISRVGDSKGQAIVPVVAPVMVKGKFTGIIGASVNLKALTQHYLNILRVSPATEVYLLDSEGTFLFSAPDSSVEGKNAFDWLTQHPFLGSNLIINSLKKELAHPTEDKMQAVYINSQTNSLDLRLMVYTPVVLGDHQLLLVMASPYSDALALIKPIYLRELAVFLIAVGMIVGFGYFAFSDRQKTLSK